MGLLDALTGGSAGGFNATAPGAAPLNPTVPQPGLLGKILGPTGTQFARAMASGLLVPKSTTDGVMAFAQGLGGSQAYYGQQEELAKQRAIDAQKLAYQQQQDTLSNSRADRSLSLQEQNMKVDNARADAAAKREEYRFEQEKSAYQAQLDDLAANNGIPKSVRDDAMKAASDYAEEASTTYTEVEDGYGATKQVKTKDPEKYKKILRETYQEQLKVRTSKPGDSLSDPAAETSATTNLDPSLEGRTGKTATGKPFKIVNGVPVDPTTGTPVTE